MTDRPYIRVTVTCENEEEREEACNAIRKALQDIDLEVAWDGDDDTDRVDLEEANVELIEENKAPYS